MSPTLCHISGGVVCINSHGPHLALHGKPYHNVKWLHAKRPLADSFDQLACATMDATSHHKSMRRQLRAVIKHLEKTIIIRTKRMRIIQKRIKVTTTKRFSFHFEFLIKIL